MTSTSDLVYDRAGLCEAMGCGYKRACRILMEHGVTPLDYGKGRSGGLRWLKESVMEVLHIMACKGTPLKAGRKSRRHHSIAGKDADALFTEFERSRMPVR